MRDTARLIYRRPRFHPRRPLRHPPAMREAKIHGYRLEVVKHGPPVALYSRHSNEWTASAHGDRLSLDGIARPRLPSRALRDLAVDTPTYHGQDRVDRLRAGPSSLDSYINYWAKPSTT
jgi:hypothetical protein